MGRGRKKQYIKVLTSKDKEMLRAFRNCGRLSSSHLKDNLSMANRRVLNFERDGYVEKVRLFNHQTKEMDAVYQLTKKGQEIIESQLNLTHCYRSVGGRHDLAIADKYFSLTKVEQNSWWTEGELREIFQTRFGTLRDYETENKKVSSTDGGYVAESGRSICFEVVTKNYSKVEIQAKVNFAVALGMQLEVSKI